jgi:hypothetical protein
LIGFVNTPAVKRIFKIWDEYMEILAGVDFGAEKQEADRGSKTNEANLRKPWDRLESNEERLKRWKRIMKLDGNTYQIRDQEVFSLVLHDNAFPDLSIFSLSIEWVCPVTNRAKSIWAEGVIEPGQSFTLLTENPCKSVHAHPPPRNAFKSFIFSEWITQIERIGEGAELETAKKCGGAHRINELPVT